MPSPHEVFISLLLSEHSLMLFNTKKTDTSESVSIQDTRGLPGVKNKWKNTAFAFFFPEFKIKVYFLQY